MPALSVEGLRVEFQNGRRVVRPIDDLTFSIGWGEIAVVLGPSGSGKTTLLSAIGGLLTPNGGRIVVNGTEVTRLGNREREHYRRSTVGFVFQAFNLIESLSARENIAVPLLLAGVPRNEALDRAQSLARRVGLDGQADEPPRRLSGGQQQRVAIARGLVNDPAVLLADEPTANLDQTQTDVIIDLLAELRADGMVMLVSSHDPRMVPIADQILQIDEAVLHQSAPPLRVEYEAGEVIFRQGEWGELVYVIESGNIELIAGDGHGDPVAVGHLGPGQHFGEIGPILGISRSVTATAKTAAVLSAYRVAEFRRLKSKSVPAAKGESALPSRVRPARLVHPGRIAGRCAEGGSRRSGER